MFDYVGFPAFLKPFDGGGWKNVYKVDSPDEFFAAYDQTRDLCMTLQRGGEFNEYFRCYVVGQEKVRVMPYDPRAPHHERYVQESAAVRSGAASRASSATRSRCAARSATTSTRWSSRWKTASRTRSTS